MGKDTVKIVVHDRRVEIEITGAAPTELPALAERLVPKPMGDSPPGTPSHSVARAAGRVFLVALKDVVDASCAAVIVRGAVILRWIRSLFVA
jgi:hypothetical protein